MYQSKYGYLSKSNSFASIERKFIPPFRPGR